VPTYEYECDKCREVFEIRQRITEPALTSHEGCGGAVRRLLSAAPFILKGDGWYVTDYPSESRKKAMSSEKGSETPKAESPAKTDSASKTDSGSSSTSESKPAAPATSAGASSSSSSSSTPST
jgi:putative FmdB family regulatory protein